LRLHAYLSGYKMQSNESGKSIRLSIPHLILRNIYKVIYKYSHSKALKHNRRYWPYYAVERNEFTGINKIFFKKQLIVDNTQTPSTQKKCMLVATGPSIQDIPDSVFQQHDMDYFGVNGAISLTHVHFKYYIIIDHNFTTKRFDLVQKVLKSECIFFTTPRCLDLILRSVKPENIRCQMKVIETITEGKVERLMGHRETVNLDHPYYFTANGKGFSKHIQDAVFDYFTVSYVALQIIHSLAAKEIYLAGLDMNNFNQPRFYENSENKQPTMLDQYIDDVLPAFDLASTFLKTENTHVYNLSPTSAINAFEKLNLLTLHKGTRLEHHNMR
jgi:Kdo-III transferase WaaZ